MKKDLFIAFILVVIAVLSRFISHSWNFTAMGAVAITAGLIFKNRLLPLIVVMVSLLVSDAVIGFHNLMIAVYLGYVLMTLVKSKSILVSSILGSIVFFLVSNFGVWLEGVLYPQNFAGLMACYTMAVPFFKNELISNVILTPVLFYGLRYMILPSSRVVDVA